MIWVLLFMYLMGCALMALNQINSESQQPTWQELVTIFLWPVFVLILLVIAMVD